MRALSGPGAPAELIAEMRCLQAGARVCTAAGRLPGPHAPHPVIEVPSRGAPIRVRVRPAVGFVFTPPGLERRVRDQAVVGGLLDAPARQGELHWAEAGTSGALLCKPDSEGWAGRLGVRLVVLEGARGKPKEKILQLLWGDAAHSFTWYIAEVGWAKLLERSSAEEPVARLAGWAASILYDPGELWGLGRREGLDRLPALGPGPPPGAAEKAAALEAEFGGEEAPALILWPGGRLGILGPCFAWVKGPQAHPAFRTLPEGGRATKVYESCGACEAPVWGEGVEVENGGSPFWVCEACWEVGVLFLRGKLGALGAARRRLERTGAEACEAQGLPGAAAAMAAAASAPEGGAGAIILEWGGEAVVCIPPTQKGAPEYELPAVRAAVMGGAAIARVRTARAEA